MSKDQESARDAISSAGNETMDTDLAAAVKKVLYGERTLWRVTE